MTHGTFAIVGAFYRPPAKALLSCLPIGAPLTLMAEPENPHDPNAIAVWMDIAAIPETSHEALADALADYGFTIDQIVEKEQWHVGYIPRDLAAKLRGDGTISAEEPSGAFFTMSTSGAPMVRLNGG